MNMKCIIVSCFCILMAAGQMVFPSVKGEGDINQIEIIFDASGSMWGRINGKTKITVAKETLLSMLDELKDRPVYTALRVYGHKNKKCSNTVCEVPMSPIDPVAIKKVIMPLKPKGKTPISLSLLRSVDDFKKGLQGERVVVLITDGIETCRGNPCDVAQKLQEQGIVTKIHIVGFGMKASQISSLECVVKPSGGILVKADDQEELRRALENIFKASLTKNLVVSAKDRTGQTVYITAIVSRENDEVARSEGNDVGFYLDPGVYDVTVINSDSGNSKNIKDIAIEQQGVAKYSVLFGNSHLVVTGKDTAGNLINTLMVIHNSKTGKIKQISENSTVHKSALEPGTYDLEVQDLETNEKQWARGVVISDNNVTEEFIFKRGLLIIPTRNTRGLPIKTNVEVYKEGVVEAFKNSPGKTVHEFILPEGIYTVVIRYWYSKAQDEIKDLEIVDNRKVEREVILDTGNPD